MKQMMRIFTLLTLLLAVVVGGYAQLPVEQNLKKSLLGIEVHFRFDNSRFDPYYMNNERSLERFAHVIDSIGLHMIDSVVVISQSSPEGVYEHNVKLSRLRAATMQRTIQQRHPELNDRLYVHPEGESWARLRESVANDKKMKQSTIDQVLRIIDSDVNVGTKKWRLQQLPIYRYLIQTHYPRIRNSVFCIVYFSKVTPTEVIPEKNEEVVEEVPAEEPVVEPIEEVVEQPQEIVEPKTLYEPLLNVHTNLLYDLGTAVNIGVEYYPRNSRWTIAANYTFPWWSKDKNHRYLQLIDGELEVRRYFDKDASYTGHYLAFYGHGNYYDFSFDSEKAWQGEGAGLGFTYGYVWQPWKNQHWKLDAFIRFGYYQSLYDPYHASNPYNGKYYYDWEGAVEDFERRNHRLRWFGPTGLGLKLSYDLNWRKVRQ